MRIRDLNRYRSDKPHIEAMWVRIGCEHRRAAIDKIAELRGAKISGVVDDAIGLWIEAHHCPWEWLRRGDDGKPAKRGRKVIIWRPMTKKQAEIIGSVLHLYKNVYDLFRRAIDAHLMRHGLFSPQTMFHAKKTTSDSPSDFGMRMMKIRYGR